MVLDSLLLILLGISTASGKKRLASTTVLTSLCYLEAGLYYILAPVIFCYSEAGLYYILSPVIYRLASTTYLPQLFRGWPLQLTRLSCLEAGLYNLLASVI